jgi:transcriptional regulator with XRE-family HTH domain
MSHAGLARAADINRWYLNQLERGARCRLGWNKLCDLATALNVSVSLLLQEAEAAPNKTRTLAVSLPRGSLPVPSRGEIGPAVRRLRRARGIAIVSLAEAAGLHRTSLSCIERGERQPGWSTLCVLAKALEVRVSTLAAAAEAETPKGHSAEP